ncbi:MAG: hypothetical protein NVV72_16240 [Asticcacaulis sp.]|nr:hypothetical protein [Asticcacaulis sp.]
MKIWLRLTMLAACLVLPTVAQAGAWPQMKGDTQAIITYEPGAADDGFDASGDKTIALDRWKQNNLSLFVDHGVTEHLTLTAKVNYRDYTTGSERFSGLSSIEVGGRWTIRRTDDFVFALGAMVEGFGKGRRNDYDQTSKGGTDYDLRAYAGRNFRLLGKDAFVDLQAARHLRQYEANEWRIDATLGVKPSPKWMVMAQVFAGRTDKAAWGHAEWANTELSVVRRFGPQQQTSLQLGLRQTAAGRNVPAVQAVVVSLWKTF